VSVVSLDELATHGISSDKQIDIDRSWHKINDDGEGKPKIRECKPSED
jgi:hypothetical protein